MDVFKLYDAELQFMRIVWELEPITSPKLVEACGERLGWKKSTTYTVLRRLCERGVCKNEAALVTALVKAGQARKYESDALLEKSFGGSVPVFIASFLEGRKLTEADAREIMRLIEEASR